MIPGYYEMIAAFLSEYMHTDGGGMLPADPKTIRSGLFLLLASGWTQEAIKREAIRAYNVIIRDDLFPRRV